jgi:ubiquinol-cytochrome c reductase cytochrome c subunit
VIVSPSTLAARLVSRRRRAAGFAVVLVCLGLLTLVYAAIAPRGTAASSTDPNVVAGKGLFNASCASCHGLNAEGGSRAPSLIGVGAAAVDFQVSTGRMPLQQIAAYIQSLAPGPKIPDVSGWEKTDVAFGGALFRTNCAQCHNFVGAGGALTYGRYAPALTNATPTQIYEAMITGPENMPVFGDRTITPAQKLAIINYVKTVQHEANPGGAGLGRIGPVSETLVGILVGLGLSVLATLWLGTRA